MRLSRIFAAGLGDQNMVIEDVTIKTETTGRKKPKTSEVLVFSVRPKATQAAASPPHPGPRRHSPGSACGSVSSGPARF